MVKKLVALYKAYRGGEWFRASLESVAPYVDGVVVAASEVAWAGGEAALPNNCHAPLGGWRQSYQDMPLVLLRWHWSDQVDQYNAGLEAIAERFGPNTAVLIVDTDELWPEESLLALKCAIKEHPDATVFRAPIRTYVKSPLYQVWPIEAARHVVALGSADKIRCQRGRFQGVGRGVVVEEAVFDHYSYVRQDVMEIRAKFRNTSSQEDRPNDEAWLADVWPKIPCVQNFHMTPGEERVWGGVKILAPAALPQSPYVEWLSDSIEQENADWCNRLQRTPTQQQLLPLHTWDIDLYTPELQRYFGRVDLGVLQRACKTSYLELLWLAWWASRVPAGGRICEIGCGFGASAATLAAVERCVDAVDAFEPYDEIAHRGLAKNCIDGSLDRFWDTLKTYGQAERVRHIPKLSQDAAKHLDMDGYDLGFIDANHSYDHVKHDMALLWSRLKPGGVLCGHDYTTRFPGVIQAVNEFRHGASVAAGTSLWYVRKP